MILQARLSAVLLILFGSICQAGSSNLLPIDSAGLSLFMTIEEQRNLEKTHATASAPAPVELPDDPVIESTNILSQPQSQAKAVPFRYDGILLKNGQMLDMWIDSKRVSELDQFTSAELQEVDSIGQLYLTSGDSSVRLFPGDSYPQVGLTASSSLEPSADHLIDINLSDHSADSVSQAENLLESSEHRQ